MLFMFYLWLYVKFTLQQLQKQTERILRAWFCCHPLIKCLMFLPCRWVDGLQTNMTANKNSKAVARAGGGKCARDVPDRSVTSGRVWFSQPALPVISLCLPAHSFSNRSLYQISICSGFSLLYFYCWTPGKNNQRLSIKPSASEILFWGQGPIHVWTVSAELVLACWKLTVSCSKENYY